MGFSWDDSVECGIFMGFSWDFHGKSHGMIQWSDSGMMRYFSDNW